MQSSKHGEALRDGIQSIGKANRQLLTDVTTHFEPMTNGWAEEQRYATILLILFN